MAGFYLNTENADFFINGVLHTSPFFRTNISFRLMCIPFCEYGFSYPPILSRVNVRGGFAECASGEIGLINFGDGNYELFVCPDQTTLSDTRKTLYQNLFTLGESNHLATITTGNCFEIECDTCFFKTTIPTLTDIKLATICTGEQSLFVLKGDNGKKKLILAVSYSDDYCEILREYCDELVVSEDKITTTTQLADMQGHIVVKSYAFDNQAYTLLSQRAVSTRKAASGITLLPFLFLEAIAAGDFDTAKSLTLPILHNDIASFKEFFGTYVHCTANRFDSSKWKNLLLVSKEDASFIVKCFAFELCGGQISDVALI